MKIHIFVLAGLTVLSVISCSDKESPTQMSPTEIVNLFQDTRNDGNIEIMREILYFAPDTTEEQKQERVRSILAGSDEKIVMNFVGTTEKVEYEKLIDEETAEVGLVLGGANGFLNRVPTGQIILKKKDGMWKYHYNKYELSEDKLIKMIRQKTNDNSLYYLLGRWIVNENPAKAYRYFKKYYDLEPDGFWVCDSFLKELKELENPKRFETKLLADLHGIPEYSPDRALSYRFLGQMYMEHNNYEKAQEYFSKAEEILKIDKDTSEIESLKKVKHELELRLKGKYVDPLDEIDKSQQK